MHFSIVIPVYNSEKYLDRCLRSIYEQQYENFEVLIIDDGSTDASKQIAESYQKMDSRFKYRYKQNEGPGSARNLGIKLSKGDYICFLDSDDELLPEYFVEINKVLVKYDLDILEINALYMDEDSKDKKKYQNLSFNNKVMNGVDYLSAFLKKYNYFNVVPWTKVINRQFILENHLLFKNIYAEDELWARECFISATKVMFLDKCIYLQHRRSLSQSKKKYEEENVISQKHTYYVLEHLYKQKIGNSKKLNPLLNELSHSIIAVSILNLNVPISYKDKLFTLHNARGIVNFINALLFFLSPRMRKWLKK